MSLPSTMRAAVQLAYGVNKEAIQVKEVPLPQFDENSDMVLVQVHAAAINPVDYKLARGDMKAFMGREFPHVLGFDAAGVVVKVGSKCARIKVGDEVYGDTLDRGSMAEYVAAPEAYFCAKPTNVTFEEAASIPLAVLTAYQGLKNQLQVKAGDKVLILGGSGGVGSLAIQVAKVMGLTVVTTSSNVDLCKQLGADRVINYKNEKWEDVLKGENFDAVYDCVGEAWPAAVGVLKAKGGKFTTIVGDKNDATVTFGAIASTAGAVIYRGLSGWLGLAPSYSFFLTDATDYKSLEQVKEWVEKGVVKPLLDPKGIYTIDTAVEMFEHMMTHRAKGKLVMKIR